MAPETSCVGFQVKTTQRVSMRSYLTGLQVEENFFGNSGRAEEPSGSGGEELIVSQTLESVFEEQEAVFRVCGVGGGGRVAELSVRLVAL